VNYSFDNHQKEIKLKFEAKWNCKVTATVWVACCAILFIDMINQQKECQRIIYSLFFYILQQRNDVNSTNTTIKK